MKVVLIHGDGVGSEICEAVKELNIALNTDITFEEFDGGREYAAANGKMAQEGMMQAVRDCRWALKGPTGTPVGTGMRSLNVYMRRSFQTYANVRPLKSILGVPNKFVNVDIVVVRENTEDVYAGLETMADDDTAHAVKVITRAASERVCRYAFEYAQNNGRHKVTCAHKAEILKMTDGLFLESFRRIAREYPSITAEDEFVDELCMRMIQRPTDYDVVVAPNQYGDIISDLGGALVGGAGFTAAANIGEDVRFYESVHGYNSNIAGLGVANPSAIFTAYAMMLNDMGKCADSARVKNALAEVWLEGIFATPDVGGISTTQQFTQAVIDQL